MMYNNFSAGRPNTGEVNPERLGIPCRTSGVTYTNTQGVGGHRTLSDGTNIVDVSYDDCTCFPMIDPQGGLIFHFS